MATSFGKNDLILTVWTEDLEPWPKLVPGTSLEGLVAWNTDFCPVTPELVRLAAAAGLKIAMFGRNIPADQRNPDTLRRTLLGEKCNIPIATFPETVVIFEREDGKIGLHDLTKFGQGNISVAVIPFEISHGTHSFTDRICPKCSGPHSKCALAGQPGAKDKVGTFSDADKILNYEYIGFEDYRYYLRGGPILTHEQIHGRPPVDVTEDATEKDQDSQHAFEPIQLKKLGKLFSCDTIAFINIYVLSLFQARRLM